MQYKSKEFGPSKKFTSDKTWSTISISVSIRGTIKEEFLISGTFIKLKALLFIAVSFDTLNSFAGKLSGKK
mgnify:CR=1 FL=1